jgi:hypothetical protein
LLEKSAAPVTSQLQRGRFLLTIIAVVCLRSGLFGISTEKGKSK